MPKELEMINNGKPSEAIECVDYIKKKLEGLRYECERTNNHRCDDLFIQEHIFTVIKQALQRLNKYEQILGSGRLTNRNYKNTTLDIDSCKPYLRLGQLEDIYEEGK